jgi:DNA-binding transcriptional LysR family regulator
MRIRMDWRAVRFDWNRARAFLVTAEEGSLSAAARALGLTQPTLGRQVEALEEELGVVLFERAGKGLVLTPGGLELLDHVRGMGEAAGRVSLAASGQTQSVEGSICITASEIYAAHLLPAIVVKLRRQAPGIEVEVVASNAAVDLRRREADIAIRSFRPTQPDLVARKVADAPACWYAAPTYLASIGNPRSSADFSRAAFIGFDGTDGYVKMLAQRGVTVTARNFPIVTLNHLVHWEMVKQGAGIGVVPQVIGDAEPKVVRVLADVAPMPFEMWLTTHRELHTSRRVRVVYDFLVEELSRSIGGR